MNELFKSVLNNTYLFGQVNGHLHIHCTYDCVSKDGDKARYILSKPYKQWISVEDICRNGHQSLLYYKLRQQQYSQQQPTDNPLIEMRSYKDVVVVCQYVTDETIFSSVYRRWQHMFISPSLLQYAVIGVNCNALRILISQTSPVKLPVTIKTLSLWSQNRFRSDIDQSVWREIMIGLLNLRCTTEHLSRKVDNNQVRKHWRALVHILEIVSHSEDELLWNKLQHLRKVLNKDMVVVFDKFDEYSFIDGALQSANPTKVIKDLNDHLDYQVSCSISLTSHIESTVILARRAGLDIDFMMEKITRVVDALSPAPQCNAEGRKQIIDILLLAQIITHQLSDLKEYFIVHLMYVTKLFVQLKRMDLIEYFMYEIGDNIGEKFDTLATYGSLEMILAATQCIRPTTPIVVSKLAFTRGLNAALFRNDQESDVIVRHLSALVSVDGFQKEDEIIIVSSGDKLLALSKHWTPQSDWATSNSSIT
ncbi:hypothetical protein SAMD00019534_038490 [Acytostelium subglobosum LB1]|uniref:hypothetical protein n=1 Tax=Acytostelium subglobosum LB1 TaxID=1410327 RepID=UPI0006451669|nr:hypothetical protein SAMD00019534_038490 [Acytostelium subglobosum LB1]GAM20674.1 hypothetical protein SAMD00019534_038490 [Acytostelium subglobosum LB1]|eukprot:XP_012760195.1 hypothetical protein SAMD00019534_038490 [Acytostelium subglobosum LB1]